MLSLPVVLLSGDWAIVVFVCVFSYALVRYVRSPWRKVPPGPRGLPFLGNIRELSNTRWLTSPESKAAYGDIMHLRIPGQSVVFLNSQKVAADRFDRRAAIYSDRPHLILVSEMYTGGMELSLAPYGDRWRRMRRAAHEGLNIFAVKQYQPVQSKEAVILALDILVDSTNWAVHLRRHAASLIMSVLYDKPTTERADDESVVKINEHVMRLVVVTLPGSNWVQIFPWMKHIPSRFAKWKRTALTWFSHDSDVFQGLMDNVRSKLAVGIESASLGATLIAYQERIGLSDLEIAWLASQMFIAGAETTSSSLEYRDRAPVFSDLPALPYHKGLRLELEVAE
ncbi:cytochrome P450 [Artomyces pyxidatus]|uniref:Cytochrome P450 n=1 Tax=Artomyces pyxidatus TaxID=48021 RepID=A0ACB8SHU6_9AGAM|nr:cytochrome P450 [Artomyces pyxidatus]